MHIDNFYNYIDVNIDILRSDDVVGAFTYLFNILGNLFDRMDFSQLKRACSLRGTNLSKLKEEMKEAQKVEDILDVFDKNPLNCNWLNVRLFKRIARNTGIQQAINWIQIYEDNVYSRKVSDVKKYFSHFFDQTTMAKVEIKINKYHKDITVKEIVEKCEELEKFLDIDAGGASAVEFSPGCIKITVVIPMHFCFHAFSMAKRNNLKLRQFHIQYLKIESFPIVFALNFPDKESDALILSLSVKCM